MVKRSKSAWPTWIWRSNPSFKRNLWTCSNLLGTFCLVNLFACGHWIKDLVSIFGRLEFECECINHTPPKSKTVCDDILFLSLYIWSNQLYEQSGRTLPADSGLMINWLHPGETQIRGKTEIQLAFIFQRWEWWDFENAFYNFDGSDRTSLAAGLAGHQGPKPSCEQPVPTFPELSPDYCSAHTAALMEATHTFLLDSQSKLFGKSSVCNMRLYHLLPLLAFCILV